MPRTTAVPSAIGHRARHPCRRLIADAYAVPLRAAIKSERVEVVSVAPARPGVCLRCQLTAALDALGIGWSGA
ncbi:hypothetical protein SCD90_13770 [Terrihabitans sp. PJ23]|uniref:Uncharacterized protein n=1 Tax=Terrihabitans rhizophilus TaxID=3092662 RepID=A0ABU4RQM0_9HYPH|nr:hypothetical protein [Terrihabitans sp. PJ23]